MFAIYVIIAIFIVDHLRTLPYWESCFIGYALSCFLQYFMPEDNMPNTITTNLAISTRQKDNEFSTKRRVGEICSNTPSKRQVMVPNLLPVGLVSNYLYFRYVGVPVIERGRVFGSQ
jgi:hypothetical protein